MKSILQDDNIANQALQKILRKNVKVFFNLILEGESGETPPSNIQNKKTSTPKKRLHRKLNEAKPDTHSAAETIAKAEITSGVADHGASLRGIKTIFPRYVPGKTRKFK